MASRQQRPASRWWSRARGLPEEVYRSYLASLEVPTEGGPPRILAWGRTPDGYCIGAPAHLSYGNTGGWSLVGWHEIERGGWNADTSRLRWTRYTGVRDLVELTEPGRLPELFRERVAASIVLEKVVPVHGGRGVTITGRRDLGNPESAIVWHTRLGTGLSWDGEGVESIVDQALAEVRTEYDIG